MLLLALLWTSCSFGQVEFGLGLGAYTGKLNHIVPESLHSAGFSGADFQQRNQVNVSFTFLIRKPVARLFSLETGIGYLPVSHHIDFQHQHEFFPLEIDTTLHIKMHYLRIPILFNFRQPISDKVDILFSGGIDTKIRFKYQDNYMEIIWEQIAFLDRKKWYAAIIASPLVSAGIEALRTETGYLELVFFFSHDMNPFVNENKAWGFYKNLATAKNIRYGLEARYFFK